MGGENANHTSWYVSWYKTKTNMYGSTEMWVVSRISRSSPLGISHCSSG